LESILAPHQGGECRVLVTLRFANSRALLRLGEHFHVFPRERLLVALQELAGKQRVKFFKDRYKFNEANHWSSEF
ncbi:MAG: hypothetical protein HQL55_19735, partial [Magnetococcales bacterium]|nr:hypothetical protein [Magnetococcales bacterium]